MEIIQNVNQCCGCGACYNICPSGAISMLQNEEGFLYPFIDENKCTNCGLCQKVCNTKNTQNNVIEAYAAFANDDVREVSSSGGVFPLLGEKILENGGYVCGASFTNDYKSVEHVIISSKEELYKLRSSKYVQSDTKNVYKELQKLLKEGKQVLFSGTPCQVDGLNKFLQKEYENLITVDILCHGVPSPVVWEKYLEEVSAGKKVIKATFRDKKVGWTPSLLLLLFEDNLVFEETSNDNLYYKAFLQNLCLRKSCATCSYTSVNRTADITVGDFWGVNKFDKKMNDKKGTSCVLVNTQKGKLIFNSIISSLKKYKRAPLNLIVKGNPILKEPAKTHPNRDKFFRNLLSKNILENIKDSLKIKYDGVIANFWASPRNYGAILTAYSIQQYFKEKNMDYYILNFVNPKSRKEFETSFCKTFANKYLKLTQAIENLDELKNLNIQTDNFVVGSDQVFRYVFIEKEIDLYLLKFTEFSKRRVAFSASFGIDDYEANDEQTYFAKKALKRFDSISVRECSGVDLCKKTFGVNAEHIIDPVFLIDKQKFEDLIDKSNKKYENKIVYYILDKTPEIEENIKILSANLNLDVECIYGENLSVEEWLTALKTCKYFLTDSFHGTCFSLIFHKPFICLRNKNRGNARFDSLEKTFRIKSCFVSCKAELANSDLLENSFDWNEIDKVISVEKEKAENWFKQTFDKPKETTQEKVAVELDFLKDYSGKSNILKNTSFIEQLFSIKKSENGKHKIITLCGIKLKMRRGK